MTIADIFLYIKLNIISILFRLINFGVLLFLARYFFYRTIKPMLERFEHDNQAYKGSLQEQMQALSYQKEQMLHAVAQQELRMALLKKNVLTWRESIDQDVRDRDQYIQNQKEYMLERAEQQQALLEKEYLARIVLPKAVNMTEKELREKYKNSELGRTYIARIITSLEKGV